MMRVDDLVAAIAALQRSDLEAWIREELVVPRRKPENTALHRDGMRTGPPDLHAAAMSSRSTRTRCRSFCR